MGWTVFVANPKVAKLVLLKQGIAGHSISDFANRLQVSHMHVRLN